MVKNPPEMRESQEMQVQFLNWEDPTEEEMATHSSILAWRIHGQRSLGGYSPWDRKSWTRLSDLDAHTQADGLVLTSTRSTNKNDKPRNVAKISFRNLTPSGKGFDRSLWTGVWEKSNCCYFYSQ